MNPSGSYQFEKLESRHIESSRLAERAQLRIAGFKDLMIRHGFPSNGKILEIGTAQGIRARLMAESFPNAEIIGIDRSPELLAEAQQRHQDVANLSFQEADLYNLPFANESFDFVYARLVFMHLARPMEAVESLKRVLRPGGRILIEDADRDCMFFEPAPASFSDFWKKVQDGQRRLGGNPNVGRHLAPYLKEAAFQNVQCDVQPILGAGADIEFLVRTLMPSLNIYLDPVDRASGELAIRDLKDLAEDPRATFYHFWFAVSGEKTSGRAL
jgi:ubiquinone/menaquinone biosynthesis C-methylase UbiE